MCVTEKDSPQYCYSKTCYGGVYSEKQILEINKEQLEEGAFACLAVPSRWSRKKAKEWLSKKKLERFLDD